MPSHHVKQKIEEMQRINDFVDRVTDAVPGDNAAVRSTLTPLIEDALDAAAADDSDRAAIMQPINEAFNNLEAQAAEQAAITRSALDAVESVAKSNLKGVDRGKRAKFIAILTKVKQAREAAEAAATN